MSRTSSDVQVETPPGHRTKIVTGGVAWILSTVVFFGAQLFAAAAWHHPTYSWTGNYISDLGNTKCALFAVPHGPKAFVCSPRHTQMNIGFVVNGLLFLVGAVLLRFAWPPVGHSRVAVVLFIIAGVGKVIVGLVPENTRIGLHLVGALNIPIVCVAVIFLSVALWPSHRDLAAVSMALAVIGLIGTILSSAGQFGSDSLYLGLGVGGMERVSDYPMSLWTLLMGCIVVASPQMLRA